MLKQFYICMLLSILVLSGINCQSGDMVKRAAIPATGHIVIRDAGYHGWGPELVHYKIDTRVFKPGRLKLLNAEKKPIPFYIDGKTLSFIASLKKGQQADYYLEPSTTDQSRAGSSLTVQKTGGTIDVGNSYYTLKLPGEKTETAVKNPEKIPVPILGWKSSGSPWLGRAFFKTGKKLAAYRFKILENNPVLFVYEARYDFKNDGEYIFRIQCSPDVPYAGVTEEIDSKTLKKFNHDFLAVDLSQGWQPEDIDLVVVTGELSQGVKCYNLKKYIDGKKTKAAKLASIGGQGKPPKVIAPEKNWILLDRVAPAGKWGSYVGGFGLKNGSAHSPTVGIVPLHVGNWRRTTVLNFWANQNHHVLIALPISTRWVWWHLDCADEQSPFSTHEHDKRVPVGYSRREWAMYFGKEGLAEAQNHFGFIGLDRYKDWVLDWPEGGSAAHYPRAFFTPAMVKEIKGQLAQHPDRKVLEKYYVISGKKEDAVNHGKRFLQWVKHAEAQEWRTPALSHYRQAGQLKAAHLAEDALACPDLPEKMRQAIRKNLAMMAYILSDPDFNPRGAGVHLGNNNMTINRTIGLVYFAPLLPDHPKYDYWMKRLHDFVDFKLKTQGSQDGTWIACPNYQLYGPTRFLDTAINILRNTGYAEPDWPDRQKRILFYTMNLTMPDPRFNNLRIIPGMGNSGNRLESIFGLGMRAATAKDDPFRGKLLDMHKRCLGANGVAQMYLNSPFNAFNYLPATKRVNAGLKTEFFPTYGVMFREKFGTPDETAMLFRAASNWSHWDPDDLNLILYAKGAPLSPGTGYGYIGGPAIENNAIYHNQVKVAQYDAPEVFGRVDDGIIDYGFEPYVDYAVAERFYPGEAFKDKIDRVWRRHVMFLKRPESKRTSYFVVKDTFPGNPVTDQTWWTWLNLGDAGQIRVDGNAFDPKQVPFNKKPDFAKLPVKTGRTLDLKTAYGANTYMWFANKKPIKFRPRITFSYGVFLPDNPTFPDLKFAADKKNKTETKTVLEGMAAKDSDYFYVIYPYKNGETLPVFKRISDSVVKITTSDSTDYVFISDKPLKFDKDGVVFDGKAGAVRIFKDKVVLIMNSGSGKIGYQNTVLTGNGPFERGIPLSQLKPGSQTIAGGYPKKYVTKKFGGNLTVSGEEPFDIRVKNDIIELDVDGRERVLLLDQPEFISRPEYFIDGKEWMACWNDWPANGFGRWKNSRKIALSVPAGKHKLIIRNLQFPQVWDKNFKVNTKTAIK